MKRVVLFLVLIATYLVFLGKLTEYFIADIYFVKSQSELDNQEFLLSQKNISLSIDQNPSEPAYYRWRAKAYLASQVQESNPLVISELKEKALNDLNTAKQLNSHNLATLRNSIPLYYFLAVEDVAKSSNETSLNENYVSIIENYYRELKQAYPNDLGLFADVAKYEKRLGLMKEYEESYEKAKGLRPDIVEWHEAFR